jgi:hypothetical protein
VLPTQAIPVLLPEALPMIPLPKWVPPQIADIFCAIEAFSLTDRARVSTPRLATDDRMRGVWEELLRKNRESGKYFHPACPRPGSTELTADARQTFAIRELIWFAICATRDERAVSRPEEIEQSKRNLKDHSHRLRVLALDLELATELGQLGIVDDPSKELASEHFRALNHIAGWLDNLAGALRRLDDPLMVRRVRGDALVKGVQITLAGICLQHFGARLDGTVATIASVAVGTDAKRRAARSALSRKKPT